MEDERVVGLVPSRQVYSCANDVPSEHRRIEGLTETPNFCIRKLHVVDLTVTLVMPMTRSEDSRVDPLLWLGDGMPRPVTVGTRFDRAANSSKLKLGQRRAACLSSGVTIYYIFLLMISALWLLLYC